MNFVSYEFIAFVCIVAALYFIFPMKIRYLVLLLASLFFYWTAGWQKLIFLGAAALVTYLCGLAIQALRNPAPVQAGDAGSGRPESGREPGRDRKEAALAVFLMGLMILLAMLIYAKAGERLVAALADVLRGKGLSLTVLVPLGISYYTLAAIGYLADVYWKKDTAEKNPLKLILYLCYFPQILQGPIPKHRNLGVQLGEGHRFDYDRVCFGLQRAVWGFFKKLVIADRLAIMVNQVFENYLEYSGFIFLFALAGAVFQLYADFSGCVDIALGISEVFGITLEENFRRPFYSTSSAEFWRRWHISLGSWFRDYVYMPVSVSPAVISVGRLVKKLFGRTAARNVMTTIPLLAVWILTGLWHGTGWDYLVWGLYWGMIIILSTWLAPVYRKIERKLGLDTGGDWWRILQRVRTFAIYMVGRLLTLPGNLLTSRWIGRKIFTWNPWVVFDGTLFSLGWDHKDAWVAIIALCVLWRVSNLQEKGIRIRETVAKWPLPVRWAFYYGAVFAVLIFGIYGSGVSTSMFVYMNF
ncbi:MAG: MBOAT family protein [Lachnospiraceae bacterium]|nr:MBOAT family protein [Lachnospiraceae bacterium]